MNRTIYTKRPKPLGRFIFKPYLRHKGMKDAHEGNVFFRDGAFTSTWIESKKKLYAAYVLRAYGQAIEEIRPIAKSLASDYAELETIKGRLANVDSENKARLIHRIEEVKSEITELLVSVKHVEIALAQFINSAKAEAESIVNNSYWPSFALNITDDNVTVESTMEFPEIYPPGAYFDLMSMIYKRGTEHDL